MPDSEESHSKDERKLEFTNGRDYKRASMKEAAKQLLVHNIKVNGLKATIYCYGVSASKYIEYASALAFLSSCREDLHTPIVEIGCGHSILPSFWQSKHVETLALDINREALKWQINESKGIVAGGRLTGAVLADMRFLPLRESSVQAVSCITAIQHIPSDGDVKAIHEMGMVLEKGGVSVISFSFSLNRRTYFRQERFAGIPRLLQWLFGPTLQTILTVFRVDRTESYSERLYSQEDSQRRIVLEFDGKREDYLTLKSGKITKLIHQKIVPTGVITILEYVIAMFMTVNKAREDADAIILKLRKQE